MLQLFGSRVTAKILPREEIERLVINEVNEDLAGNGGVRTIQARVAYNEQQHIPRYATLLYRYVTL